MRHAFRFSLLALALIALLVPAASFAQSAGDEQYTDPFQNETGQSGGGGGSGGGENSGGGGGGTVTQGGGGGGGAGSVDDSTGGSVGGSVATESGSTTTGAAETTADASGSAVTGSGTLPVTGLPLMPVVFLGLWLVGIGAALRRGA